MPTRLIPKRGLREDLQALQTFVRQRQKNWTHVARDLSLIRQQYVAYTLGFDRCTAYSTLQPRSSRAKHLNALYDQSPNCLSYIGELRDRANAKLSVCPYCGLPGRLTLDHYLPRAVAAFPQFSVYSLNLVPACDACQSAKGAFVPARRRIVSRTVDRTNTRSSRLRSATTGRALTRALNVRAKVKATSQPSLDRILHPYFDNFLTGVVWRLEPRDISKAGAGLDLIPASLSLRHSSLVRFHIKKLKVAERSRKDISHWLQFVAQYLRENGIQTFLPARNAVSRLHSSMLEKDLTPNSIACVVLRAIETDAALLQTVLARALQPTPVLTVRSQGVPL